MQKPMTELVDNSGTENLKSETTCAEIVSDPMCDEIDLIIEFPDYWALDQINAFCEKSEWLIVENKKLGCRICKEVGKLGSDRSKQGMNIAPQWATISVSSSGESKKKSMISLGKKIFKHKNNSTHQVAMKILITAKENPLESACSKAFKNEREVTANVFHTAYKVAKKSQAFNDFESEVAVQKLKEVKMNLLYFSI